MVHHWLLWIIKVFLLGQVCTWTASILCFVSFLHSVLICGGPWLCCLTLECGKIFQLGKKEMHNFAHNSFKRCPLASTRIMETVVSESAVGTALLSQQWHFSIPVSSLEVSTYPSKDLEATVQVFYKHKAAGCLQVRSALCCSTVLWRKCIAVTDLTRTPQNFWSTLWGGPISCLL